MLCTLFLNLLQTCQRRAAPGEVQLTFTDALREFIVYEQEQVTAASLAPRRDEYVQG